MERLQNLKCLDTHFLAVELIVWVVFLVLLTLYLTDNLLLSMSFIAFMMSAGRIINAVTEFLSGFIIDRTHTLSLGKYDAQAANNGIAQSSVTLFAERCGYAVVPLVCSILLVLISNFMNADEEVIKLRNTQ